MTENPMGMPQLRYWVYPYQPDNCHKVVWALKIAAIAFDSDEAKVENRETDGSAIITPHEDGYAPFKVPGDYVLKHNPQVGGYFVLYKNGYKSFSPPEAFEGDYNMM